MASSDADKKKLILAIVVLALAGLVIAWNSGLFSGSTPAPTPAPQSDPSAPKQGGGAREIK